MKYYRQCLFRKGESMQVAWVEESKAKLNAQVEIKSAMDDNDKDGWVISEVGARTTEDFLKMHNVRLES